MGKRAQIFHLPTVPDQPLFIRRGVLTVLDELLHIVHRVERTGMDRDVLAGQGLDVQGLVTARGDERKVVESEANNRDHSKQRARAR